MPFEPIENYGVIGNMQSIGLVGMNGSIDFLCYPNFDSPTICAALLDDQNGGRFEIRPQLTNARVRQMYLPETNILITRFLAEEGVSELTDYMPIDNDGGEPNEIVRKVEVIRGDVRFQMSCKPRFSYATCGHQLELSELCATFRPFSSDCPPMALHSTVRLGRRDDDVTADFRLKAGQTATFLFGSVRVGGTQSELDLLDQRFRNTAQFWKAWISRSRYKGRWREMVHRSALVLKLLISRKHGSLIAAPTFSLPENIGGVRNWDYRFTWLRDATFTLYALTRLGFVDETEAFIEWLKGRLSDDAQRGPLHQLGGSITVIMKEGVAHHPHSLEDATPIADWIEQHMHPVEANRPAFADSTYTKSHYYSLENSYIYLKKEDTCATVRGPGYVPSYDRYDGPGTGNFHADAMSIVVPQKPAPGKPWVFHPSFLDRDSAVDLALLAKGYHIVLPPISGAGAVQKEWDEVYQRMVDNGFSKKVVMEGTGAKAGESYAWAIANPDKVSVIYARNPLLRSLMSTTPPIDNLAPLAKAGVPILHDCGSLDPWLKDQTRVVEKRYKELGGKITVLVTEGEGHFPVSRKDPKPVVDFIVSHQE